MSNNMLIGELDPTLDYVPECGPPKFVGAGVRFSRIRSDPRSDTSVLGSDTSVWGSGT